MQKYQGSCHCEAVTFEVEMELTSAMECNCSHCFRKGFLLSFIPEAQFTLLTGQDMLTEYRFNKKHIAHLFCKVCGTQAFGKGVAPDGTATIAVNVRCLKDIDVSSLSITQVDGKSF
jgi:hypothetical protein